MLAGELLVHVDGRIYQRLGPGGLYAFVINEGYRKPFSVSLLTGVSVPQ